MKRIKRFILTFIALFIIFPYLTNAATELSASTQNPIVGDTLYVQLEANYGTVLNIRDFHVYIDYDSTYFEVVQIKWVKNRREMGTHFLEPGKIHVDKTDGNWTSGPVLQAELKVLKAGSTRINIVEKEKAVYTNGNDIAQTMAGIIINSVNPNSNTYLSKLYVKDYNMQPAFKKSQLSYNLIVPPEVSEIEIVAKKSDSTQTITGIGKKQLRYGNNKFRVVVTAQNKDSRTYEIMINRTDNRTGDLSLKTLQVTGTNIKAEKDKKEYSATVSRSVDSILISARTNDPMATLTGTGQKNLKIGLNTFEITVESANGLEETYKINITRSTEEIKGPVISSKLKILKVNGLVLNISEENKLFLYGISNKTNNLNINAITESETAKVEIIGNEKLKAGINKVSIKVTQVLEEGIPATEETEEIPPVIEETIYTLVVYKNPSNAEEITVLDEITGDNNHVFSTIEQNSHIVSKDKIELLVNNQKNLYYNVVNMYNGLLYQVKLPTNMEIKDYNLKLTKIDSFDLTYKVDLPASSKIVLYLGENYEDGSSVQLYSYNEGEQYKLITAGLEVNQGYLTIETNGDTHYVITTRDLIKIESNADKIISIIKIIGIGGGIGLIAILIIPRLLKKKNKNQNNEPLY